MHFLKQVVESLEVFPFAALLEAVADEGGRREFQRVAVVADQLRQPVRQPERSGGEARFHLLRCRSLQPFLHFGFENRQSETGQAFEGLRRIGFPQRRLRRGGCVGRCKIAEFVQIRSRFGQCTRQIGVLQLGNDRFRLPQNEFRFLFRSGERGPDHELRVCGFQFCRPGQAFRRDSGRFGHCVPELRAGRVEDAAVEVHAEFRDHAGSVFHEFAAEEDAALECVLAEHPGAEAVDGRDRCIVEAAQCVFQQPGARFARHACFGRPLQKQPFALRGRFRSGRGVEHRAEHRADAFLQFGGGGLGEGHDQQRADRQPPLEQETDRKILDRIAFSGSRGGFDEVPAVETVIEVIGALVHGSTSFSSSEPSRIRAHRSSASVKPGSSKESGP